MSNVRTQIGKAIGKSLNGYHSRVKPKIDELKFKEQYQGRIIDCMVGEVDDNYIETPETDASVVKLEHSKEGLVKVPSIKGKTILVDADGNETDTPGEGCRLVSVGEDRDKIIILSNNPNLVSGMEIGGYSDDGEKLNGISQTQARCIEPIYIGDGGTFYAWMDKNGINDIGTSGVWYYALDKNKQVVRSFNGYSKSYTLNKGEVYIIFRTHMQYSEYINTFKMMISTSPIIKYIEPQSHKTEILLNEPLRRIDDNIFDEIVGNKIIRRVGRVKLTKNLTYTHNRNGNNSNEVVTCFGLRIEDKSLEGSETTVIKCNMLQRGSLGTEEEYWWAYKDTIFYFSIYNHKLKSLDVNGLKDYVDKNHLEFLYVLNEPIIEELPNSISLQGFDDTTMYIENSITPTVSYGYNALIPYKEELLNQKEEVETNTLDIEQNIIPYLMDMEFNLMLMEDN